MFICYCAGTVHRPCIDRAGSVQGLTVQGVCIKCSLCRDRAGTVHGVFFCCCMDRAGTVHRMSGAKRPTCLKKSACSTLFRLQGHQRFNKIHNPRTKFQPHSFTYSDCLTPRIEHWDITRPERFKTPMFIANLANEQQMNELTRR